MSSYTIRWDQDDDQLLWIELAPHIQWDDILLAMEDAVRQIEQVNRHVSLVQVAHGPMPKGNGIPQMRRVLLMLSSLPNLDISVVVDPNSTQVSQSLLKLLLSIYRVPGSEKFNITRTVDDARAVVERHRARR